MKVRKFIYLFLIYFLFGHSNLSAQAWLQVNDPQNWGQFPGTIDEASIVVKPKGIYMEVSMYLTFSAQEAYFSPNDTLEVTLDFNLPEDAIVHDSWLWIEDEIIKADLIDRWAASAIYEEIVDRRQDPSILFKESPNQYLLRIFPMAAHSSRKVKISYLVPTKWLNNKVMIDLPYHILDASYVPLEQVEVITYLDSEWTDPQLTGLEDWPFQVINDPVLGVYHRVDLPFDEINGGLSFAVKSPLENGIYTNRNEAANIYQMVFSPAEVFDFGPTNKSIAFVMSHHPDNSTPSLDKAFVINHLRQAMFNKLSTDDSYNLFVDDAQNSGGLSPSWIPFDAFTTEDYFDDLIQNPFEDEADLPGLILKAIEFIKENEQPGEIVIISNSQNEGWLLDANPIIDQILAEIGEEPIPIHVVDYQNTNFWHFWWDQGTEWDGNEYFYENITRSTGGNYERIGSYLTRLENTLHEIQAFKGTLDVYTTLEEGLCYQRFNLGSVNGEVDLNQPILQVGKYQGSFPLKILANSIYNGNVFSEEITIPTSQVHLADTLTEEMWAGQFLQLQEESFPSNQDITNIIDFSISERVLSRYTAFLCLEPSLGGEPCLGCVDETGGGVLTDTETLEWKENIQIIAYPNPFANSVRLSLSFAVEAPLGDYQFAIYNAFGQMVKEFHKGKGDFSGTLEITWDAEAENMPGGVYYFVVTNGTSRQTFKLVFLK